MPPDDILTATMHLNNTCSAALGPAEAHWTTKLLYQNLNPTSIQGRHSCRSWKNEDLVVPQGWPAEGAGQSRASS